MDTLFELRVSLQLAEIERLGGFHPHISPFVESSRFSELLREQGFSLISSVLNFLMPHNDLILRMLMRLLSTTRQCLS